MLSKFADLHTHSTCSDGSDRPAEVVRRARERGLGLVSVTDHDTVDQLPEARAAGKRLGVEVVPGIEVNLADEPARGLIEAHLLAYFVDPADAGLRGALRELQAAKEKWLDDQTRVLAEAGLAVTADGVRRASGKRVPRRPDVWNVIRERNPGTITRGEFFQKTNFGGPWHVKKDREVSLEEAATLVRRARGVAVLAHPGAYNRTFRDSGTVIDRSTVRIIDLAAGAGVEGLEVDYAYHKNRPFCEDDGTPLIDHAEREELRSFYAMAAAERGLLITGGSDYHGANKPGPEVADGVTPEENVRALRRRARAGAAA